MPFVTFDARTSAVSKRTLTVTVSSDSVSHVEQTELTKNKTRNKVVMNGGKEYFIDDTQVEELLILLNDGIAPIEVS